MNDLGELHSHRARAQEKLRGLIVECVARLKEDRSRLASLTSPAVAAAPLAATLGFPAPPIEFVVTNRPDHHPLLDAHPAWQSIVTLRLNDPTSRLMYVAFDMAANASADQVKSEPDRLPGMTSGVHLQMLRTLGSWQRLLADMDVDAVQLSTTIGGEASSWQQVVFGWQLEKELSGNFQAASGFEIEQNMPSPDVVKSLEAQFREMQEQTQLAATIPLDEKEYQPPQARYVFRQDGGGWFLKFGDEEGHFGDLKGLQRIYKLLKAPNSPISGMTLCNGDARCETLSYSNAEAFDQQTLAHCNRELKECDEGIEEAKENDDEAQLDVWTTKKDELLAQMKRDTRLGGGSRILGEEPPAKKARITAKESIREALQKLRTAETQLTNMAEHFHQHIKTQANSLVYCPPSPELNWIT